MWPAVTRTNVYGEELGSGDGDGGGWSSFKLRMYGWKLGRKDYFNALQYFNYMTVVV